MSIESGNFIGCENTPSGLSGSNTAQGIWRINKQCSAQKASNWPTMVLVEIPVEYLVIAGGGGGGREVGGGGGAGGYRCNVLGESSGGGAVAEAEFVATEGNEYIITIGSGGIGGSGSDTADSGEDSVFGSITSIGGGGGSSYTNYCPRSRWFRWWKCRME